MHLKIEKIIKTSMRNVALGSVVCAILVFTACAPEIEKFTPEEGDVGTEVTIEGKRFDDTPAGNTVKFGGVSVPTPDITFASTTKIMAKVPSGARTGPISVTTSQGTGHSEKDFRVTGLAKSKWTFMVYLDADNNLEPAGIGDFMEMSSVGSSEDVNIIVQMDRRDGYDTSYGNWTGTRRFLIQKNDTPAVTPLDDLGEKNMGDPGVLQDFVEWGVMNYPAQHYALVIWNHGDGWRVLLEERTVKVRTALTRGEPDWGVARLVATDDTDNDVLYMKEVQTALESAKQNLQEHLNTEVKLDIVGYDACLMGMVEVSYAMRNVANCMVGSENTEPGNGWPYHTILNALVSEPTSTPEVLASDIVTKYVNSYPTSTGITQSAVDISKLNSLVAKIDAFTIKANTEWSGLNTARTNTLQYHPSWSPSCWGVDLWDFADEVYNRVTSTDIKTASLDVKNAINEFVIKESHSSDMAGSYGVAIYFPPSLTAFNNDPEHSGYEQSNGFMVVDFVKDHDWDKWLQDFYSNI